MTMYCIGKAVNVSLLCTGTMYYSRRQRTFRFPVAVICANSWYWCMQHLFISPKCWAQICFEYFSFDEVIHQLWHLDADWTSWLMQQLWWTVRNNTANFLYSFFKQSCLNDAWRWGHVSICGSVRFNNCKMKMVNQVRIGDQICQRFVIAIEYNA